MDLRRTAWDEELCDLLNVPAEVLPEIRPSSQVYGDTDPAAFLDAAVPVAGILGDQQAALFAQACFEPGQAKNTYGTGSFVLENTGTSPRLGSKALVATAACAIEGQPTEYALEGSIFVTGAAVQWLRDDLGVIGDAAETESLAASLPDWDPQARGTLVGVTRAGDWPRFADGFRAGCGLAPEVADHLLSIYGVRAAAVLDYAADDERLRERLPGTNAIAAEVPFAVRAEFAPTLADIFLRRTMTGLGADLGLESLEAVTATARATLGWSEERARAEAADYAAIAARHAGSGVRL